MKTPWQCPRLDWRFFFSFSQSLTCCSSACVELVDKQKALGKSSTKEDAQKKQSTLLFCCPGCSSRENVGPKLGITRSQAFQVFIFNMNNQLFVVTWFKSDVEATQSSSVFTMLHVLLSARSLRRACARYRIPKFTYPFQTTEPSSIVQSEQRVPERWAWSRPPPANS